MIEPALLKMLIATREEGPPGRYSCAATVAAAMPNGSELKRAFEYFEDMPAGKKIRALRNPAAAARLLAALLHLKRVETCGGNPAWGVVNCGAVCFAYYNGKGWWSRSEAGLSRVHPSCVLYAWEIR